MSTYEQAKKRYAEIGVDTDAAIEKLKSIPVALHCWQGDDVGGFDSKDALSGGILTTGNYPGKATTPEQLMQDIDKAMSLCPGKKKLNLHASYAIFEPGEFADRDKLEPKHFKKWVEYAKERNMGIDFNPTFFSHPMVKDGLTLSSPDENVRRFWIEHGKACIRISQYFAEETGVPCVMNIWAGDGFKDVPADRVGPRQRYKEAFEEIISEPHDPALVKPCVESKVFGIGVESFTAGSAEFTLSFAATHPGCLPLMDNGHYHPQEFVSDKIPALLCFFPELALHITRGVRWDSDHVVIFDDELCAIMQELNRNDLFSKTYIALDFFDASINRIAAWVIGMRNTIKAMIFAMLEPVETLKKAEAEGDFTSRLALLEEYKSYPFSAVWDYYCQAMGVPVKESWLNEVRTYERDVLAKRI